MKLSLLAASLLLLFTTSIFAQAPASARASIVDANGKSVGNLTLTQKADGVQITGALSGLPPGTHAIHIHAAGQCEPPAFTTAGGHFNPDSKQHGMKNPLGAHAGDLPNFDVAADGTANLSLLASHVTLAEGPNSLFHQGGTSLVIHASADDYMTDPSGNSGARIACGVIEK
jgi:Cu-Zn family superoxide dismutase